MTIIESITNRITGKHTVPAAPLRTADEEASDAEAARVVYEAAQARAVAARSAEVQAAADAAEMERLRTASAQERDFAAATKKAKGLLDETVKDRARYVGIVVELLELQRAMRAKSRDADDAARTAEAYAREVGTPAGTHRFVVGNLPYQTAVEVNAVLAERGLVDEARELTRWIR